MEKVPGRAIGKREHITLMCMGEFAVASPTFTRTDMVKQIYREFGVENEFVIGVQAGPPFKAWFTGMKYVS